MAKTVSRARRNECGSGHVADTAGTEYRKSSTPK